MSRLVASGCGLGYAPFAPGTVASAAAALVGLALLSSWALPVAVLAAVAGGLFAIGRLPPDVANGDPGWVVIDEVAGQWLAMLGLIGSRHPWWGTLAAFALFRVLDIAKPGPIGWIDRRHGPVPVMADDVLSGFVVALALVVWTLLTT